MLGVTSSRVIAVADISHTSHAKRRMQHVAPNRGTGYLAGVAVFSTYLATVATAAAALNCVRRSALPAALGLRAVVPVPQGHSLADPMLISSAACFWLRLVLASAPDFVFHRQCWAAAQSAPGCDVLEVGRAST